MVTGIREEGQKSIFCGKVAPDLTVVRLSPQASSTALLGTSGRWWLSPVTAPMTGQL